MNVAAILLSGVVVMSLYRVHRTARLAAARAVVSGRVAAAIAVVAVLALVVPLAATSHQVTNDELRTADVERAAGPWSRATGWQVVSVAATDEGIVVEASGPLPVPSPATFRAALDAAGLRSTSVRLRLAPVEEADLPGR